MKKIIGICLLVGVCFALGYYIGRGKPRIEKEIITIKADTKKELAKIKELEGKIVLYKEKLDSLEEVKQRVRIIVEERLVEIRNLPPDSSTILLKENLVNLGELTQPGDSLPRLLEDSCTLLSPNNVIDMNLICANYEGTKEENKILNNELIVSGEIIDMKDSVISQKDTIHQKTVQAYEGKLKKEKTKKRTWVGVSGGLALILGLIIAL